MQVLKKSVLFVSNIKCIDSRLKIFILSSLIDKLLYYFVQTLENV